MTRLSVNINKIATLRNARGTNLPNLLQVAKDIEKFGAQGITVHPRPDERHIKQQDVYDLNSEIKVEFNIEGYPNQDYLNLIQNIRPAQATLVPDPPDVLTSNAGWKILENQTQLKTVIKALKLSGTRVSLFLDPFEYQESSLQEIVDTGADRIELYTERYARCVIVHGGVNGVETRSVVTPGLTRGPAKSHGNWIPGQARDDSQNSDRSKNPTKRHLYPRERLKDEVLGVYARVAHQAVKAGLKVNAGHDLNLNNLKYFIEEIGCISEVSIGHALICDALYFGLEKTVQYYLNCLNGVSGTSGG
ncbi:MAG: pyridoxine 5'-phosphate synthase [Deltaproteobacteria bacterium]|nr:pyridoxine 5'-phosphate synthase [Deltaproteobacteria bacterium]